MMALSMEQAEQDMCGAAEFLASQAGVEGPGVGALGFCLGGGLSLWAAAACPQITAAVTYYYVMPHGKPDFTKIKGPVLGHFGTADAFISLEEANRLGTYDRAAAEDSWERSVSFLRGALAPPGS